MKMSAMDWLVWVLLFVGGLNWGLVGAFKYNLVTELLGEDTAVTMVIFVLVGLAALWSLFSMFMKGGDSNANTTMGGMK